MNEKSECDKYFVLGVLLVLGIGLCVLAFFCGEEIMRKCYCNIWNIVKCISLDCIIVSLLIGIIFAGKGIYYIYQQAKSEKENFHIISKTDIVKNCYNKNYEKIIIDTDVEFIPSQFFKNNKNLREIEIYGDIYNIGKETFFNCENLSSIKFYGEVYSIDERAFAGCKNLTTIKFYGNIPEIVDDTVFKGIENTITIYVIESNLEDAKGKFNSSKLGINFNIEQIKKIENKTIENNNNTN